ncbi:ribosome maturation factor RimM [Sandarakinorhabdus sp.]|uniref:ribosome maturation factor RimM n=1 Tax=Sandarakinorhabdus sp. TaxID=1916663 RepID=UPI00286DA614|nr:ribosome maturation factor RimM [Sandarakinorhabdus sp.]
MAGDEVILAAITGAHGIKGDVRLKLFGDGVESLNGQRVFHAGGRVLTLTSVRPDMSGGRAGAIVHFAEVPDRTQAEGLRGLTLGVPRTALPALDDGEYYHADYLGRPVFDQDGLTVGTVRAIENYGASDILDIDLIAGGTAMVPFTDDAVTERDGRLVVDRVWLV